MARKKKFDGQAGFLWNQEGIGKMKAIADARMLTPSDIYREAMAIYFAIQEGRAQIIYKPVNANTQELVEKVSDTEKALSNI